MDVTALLAAFASAFDQDNRLFTLHFSDAALDHQLLPHTLNGEEAVSECYRYELICLSADAGIELKSLMGQAVDIAIGLSDGSERILSGVITQAKQLGGDGGFAQYGLVVEPAFSTLKLRRNSRVFQDKSIVNIVELILDEHIKNNPGFTKNFRYCDQLTQNYLPRSFCQQYRESDLVFIERLLREEGISYYFYFDHGSSDVGLHTLVLFDSGSILDAAPNNSIRFHRADATEDEDTITDWQAARQLQSSSIDLASFDYKGVYTQKGNDKTSIDQGDAGSAITASLSDYDPQSLYYGASNRELNRYATLRQQAADLQTKTFSGSGVVRGMGVGQWFTLNDHPIHDDYSATDQQFAVLRQRFQARNNLPDDLANAITPFQKNSNVISIAQQAVDTGKNTAGYWNQFDSVRTHIPIVPPYRNTKYAKSTALGSQTATVVGPAGEEIYTDEHGRIKIQFHWSREQDHDLGQHGAGAANDDHSSCWVRVMMPIAGHQWGNEFLPRIGQEVLVVFIEGNIDRPVVVKVLHNGQHKPPAFSGAGSLPANKNLSGIKSQEYKGARYNELVFDDTTNEIRTKLSSEHGKTQFNQGYLIYPRSEGKGEPRGEGFELRTDNAGALRAAQGLLLTTEPQLNASGKQLDRSASQSQLEAASNLAAQLGDTAQAQHANKPEPDPALNSDPLKNKEPYLQLHGHGGIVITTPQSMAIATDKDINQIAQRDTHQTSGRRWLHNVGESISLFVTGATNALKESIKLIAAKGNIQIQAQSNEIEITADKKIIITACKEKLTATASKEFLINAGGGYIKFSGGNIEIAAPKNLSMKAGSFEMVGPVSLNVRAPEIPRTSDAAFASLIGGQSLSTTLLNTQLGEAVDLHVVPKTPKDSPQTIDLSKMQPQFQDLWKQSFPAGKSQEYGGTITTQKSGELELVNPGGGTSGSFSPNLVTRKDSKLLGVFHTHPYDKAEGGFTGVSLSGSDAAYMINKGHNLIIAQSGEEQFMYLRTSETPANVDYSALNDSQNARIFELVDAGSDFSAASKKAAIETAKNNSLSYYEGKGGIFNRVVP